eukprot:1137271-Pleurochrysis_carterae.AAC.3
MKLLCRLVLLSGLVTEACGKICDIVRVDGVDKCAPALFVPGFGKCGTNALKTYTDLHPHMRWPQLSETKFDPAKVTPEDLVRANNPGVYPSDEFIWGVKSPSESDSMDADGLARRILQAYPSSRVLFSVCDPVWLPFRWFRHYVQRTLKWEDSRQPASMLDLQSFVSDKFGLQSLVDVYHLTAPSLGRECSRSEEDLKVLAALNRKFFIGAWMFSKSKCSEFYYVNRISDFVHNFTTAGYEMGKNMDLLYMESWESDGVSMMQKIMHLLHLDPKIYNWGRTNGFQPVYSVHDEEGNAGLKTTGLEDTDGVSTSQLISHKVPEQCCRLLAMTGQRPPWIECGDMNSCFKPTLPPPASPPGPSQPPPALPSTPCLPPYTPPTLPPSRPSPPFRLHPPSFLPASLPSSPPSGPPLSPPLPLPHNALQRLEPENLSSHMINQSSRISLSLHDALAESANQTAIDNVGEKSREGKLGASAGSWAMTVLIIVALACGFVNRRRCAARQLCAQFAPDWRSMQVEDAQGRVSTRASPPKGLSAITPTKKKRAGFKRFRAGDVDPLDELSRCSFSGDECLASAIEFGPSKAAATSNGKHNTDQAQVALTTDDQSL